MNKVKNTYQKVKSYVKDHDDEVFLATTAVVLGALTIATTVWTLKEYNRDLAEYEAAKKELREWVEGQNFAGRTVYELADGSHIAVSQDQTSYS